MGVLDRIRAENSLTSAEEMRLLREEASPFASLYDAQRNYLSRLQEQGRRPVFGGLLSKDIGSYGGSTVKFEGITPFLRGILTPTAKAFDAPSMAARGLIPAEDMQGEGLGTAALAAVAAPSAKVSAPKSAMKLAPRRSGDDISYDDVYHYMKSNKMIGDKLMPPSEGPRFDRLGVHVGTPRQAEDRFRSQVGGGSWKSIDYDLARLGKETGVTLPLKVRTEKPFTIKDFEEFGIDIDPSISSRSFEIDGETVLSEDGVREAMSAYADNKGVGLDEGLALFKEELTDKGYTNIPYVNMIEGVKPSETFAKDFKYTPENVSNIMLVERTAGDPEVIRSRFAQFNDAYDPSIVAANTSKSAGILAAVSNKDPNKALKAELDPIGYQNTKMRKFLSDTDVKFTDTGENLPRNPISWEDMENKLILPFYGDRTSRGLLIEGVDDIKFDDPVYTEGGVDFMVGPAAQQDRAIWASNKNIITRIEDEATKAKRDTGGEDVYGVTGSMAPDANDFATFTGATMAELVKGSKISREATKKFNDTMRSLVDPDFVGLRSPKLREWVVNTSSPKRKAFIRLMDSNPMQAEGLPSPAQGRYAVTDPTQRDLGSGMFGLGVSKIDTSEPLLQNVSKGNILAARVPHSTYNTQIKGDYTGSLPPVPQRLIFRDVYKPREGLLDKRGLPLTEANMSHAIKTIMPVQRITPEILENIMSYLERQGQ